MAILITGGTGFIGSYLCRALLAAGKRPVALDMYPSNVIRDVLTEEEYAQVTVVQGDIANLRDVAHAVKAHGVRRVIHLASLLNPASDENPSLAVDVNIKGFVNILEAARLFELDKVVWASSVVVFGHKNNHPAGPLPNDAPHFPNNMYSASKSFGEHLADCYRRQWKLDVTGLRLTLVYGPGRVRGATAFVNELLLKPAVGEPARVPNGDDVVDWQHVEDVARLFTLAVQAPRTETAVYNTRCDVRSIREAGAFVQRLLPDARIEYMPGEYGLPWELDDSLLRRDLGFEPRVPMEKGILNVINFARAQRGLPPVTEPAD